MGDFMLENILSEKPKTFSSISDAHDYVDNWNQKVITVPMQSIKVDSRGTLIYTSTPPIEELNGSRLTDHALSQLNAHCKLPQKFADGLDPDLHVYNLNKIMSGTLGTFSIVIRNLDKNKEEKCVTAILSTIPNGVPHALVLRNLVTQNVAGRVEISNNGGAMQIAMPVIFNDQIDVLNGDLVDLYAEVSNHLWTEKRCAKSCLDFSIIWNRLVCQNGAYLHKKLYHGSHLRFPTEMQVHHYINTGVNHLRGFCASTLPNAIKIMDNTVVEEQDLIKTRSLLRGTIKPAELDSSLEKVNSVYDQVNLITNCAKFAHTSKQRNLEIIGGEIIERFLMVA